MKKQSQSFILMLLAASVLAGCGGGTPAETTAAAATETTPAETVPVSNLPDKDWEGKTFRLVSQAQDSVAWATVTFTVEEQNGDIINDEIYLRNSRVMDKYNFILENVVENNAGAVVSAIRASHAAGESEYHAALASYNAQNSLATEGLYPSVSGSSN